MSNASDESTTGLPRPRLRPVEIIRVVGRNGELVTLLRDSEKIAPRNVEVPAPLDRALVLMDGRHDLAEIAESVTASLPAPRPGSRPRKVEVRTLLRLVQELEADAMLEGPTAAARRRALVSEFRSAPVRHPTFAGGAYHGDAQELAYFLDAAFSKVPRAGLRGRIRALVAPHMDLWRAMDGYAAAYAPLRDHLPDDVETIVVLGTCHAGMRSPFAFTKKAFRTPLGSMEADVGFIDAVQGRAGVDLFADEYKHVGEHSVEFQIVLMQHALGPRARDVRIVPILCGLGRAQAMRHVPEEEDETARVLGALSEVLAGRKALVVAGADLAHVGPRFGDAAPLDRRQRQALEERDRESLRRLMARDTGGFFEHVTEDLDERRVCGTGPLYTLGRTLEAFGATAAALFGYTQHVDPDEGSIVSHASFAFVER